MTLATLRFTLRDQRGFALLSGDFNPVHLDPIAARTIAAGEPIVHGMHLLLCALDAHFRRRRAAPQWIVSARFQRPALPGDTIAVERTGEGRLALTLDVAAPLVDVTVDPGRANRVLAPVEGARRLRHGAGRKPRVRALDDIAGAHGAFAFSGHPEMRRRFPHATRTLGIDVVAAIAAVSKLVGMECPGRDSLLSAVRLEIAARARGSHLAWRVARIDTRFGLVQLDIDCGCVRGRVDAFLRPRAAAPAIDAVLSSVVPDEFAGQRALIVGGSRGLGAAAALIVAGGGGLPLVTFASGAAETAALRREARRARRRIKALRFDIVNDPIERLAQAAERFGATHLYYFATPRIFARRREPFDRALFERFARFYVTGFAQACAAAWTGTLDAFYPSSSALDERPRELTEYTAAKAAGEVLSGMLPAAMPGLRILVRRLPRVATDQTASIVTAAALDPVTAMLPIVRQMHGAARQQGTTN